MGSFGTGYITKVGLRKCLSLSLWWEDSVSISTSSLPVTGPDSDNCLLPFTHIYEHWWKKNGKDWKEMAVKCENVLCKFILFFKKLGEHLHS